MVSNHKGINLPGVAVSVPALTEKDVADLRWALATGVDMIALSFVRSPGRRDAVARKIMDEDGRAGVPVIAKIEKPQAVEHLDEIVDAFDGIMVARGDLGVELPLEQVPAGAEAGDQPGQGAGQAGHRGHPDARVDDQRAASDPGRGLRRRQRGPRRRRRGDAVRRDQRGRLPGRDRRHDGADHRRGRGELPAGGALPDPDADHDRRGDRPRRGRGRRRSSAPRRWSRSPRPATPRGGWPGTARRSRCSRSPRRPPPAASSR